MEKRIIPILTRILCKLSIADGLRDNIKRSFNFYKDYFAADTTFIPNLAMAGAADGQSEI